MKSPKKVNRRKFIKNTAATAATISIVPSSVIAGMGHIPPSDRIHIANIGCGTQGLREMSDILENPQLQLTAVCDPNKYSEDYLDWSPQGLRAQIRKTLGDKSWGANVKGIMGGREVGKDYVDRYYQKNSPNPDKKYKACRSYEDFRELLAKEKDLDAVKIMTPDHLHATIALAAIDAGKHVITHKPIANRLKEARMVMNRVRESGVKTHLMAWDEKYEYGLIKQWIKEGVIGELKAIHNWSVRPVWPQFPKAPEGEMPIPKDFNWDLWLGPVPHRPYHKDWTHNVFRGWFDFGGGSFADMGHYSLFPLFQQLDIRTPAISAKAYGTVMSTSVNGVCRRINNKSAYPYSCMYKLRMPEQAWLPAFDLYWYDGGMKPFEPEEFEEDDMQIMPEGLMFVGDKGKILAGFEGANPRIIPKARMDAYEGKKKIEKYKPERRSDTYARAILSGKESPGSFLEAECITETINLATVALRAGRKVEYDSENMKITNSKSANKFLTREYREGWEL
ncbi:MAG: Gfo/Idh/MocA family oxidoreductase [Bacteroidota bacterium]